MSLEDLRLAFFDTETTGLLKPSPAGLDKQPEIIEFYACVTDGNFRLIGEVDELIKPSRLPLEEVITKITGISDAMLETKPSFQEVLPGIQKLFTGVDAVVAHNLDFDTSMLANELLRCDSLINFPWPRHHVCTVVKSMSVRGHRLKLAELYNEMTDKEFVDAHRAKNDVHAMVSAFRGMVKKGLINLEDYIK